MMLLQRKNAKDLDVDAVQKKFYQECVIEADEEDEEDESNAESEIKIEDP